MKVHLIAVVALIRLDPWFRFALARFSKALRKDGPALLRSARVVHGHGGMLATGGMGSQLGVALAALTMIGGFELFRGLEQYRMLVFGLAMVLLMIWRPRGLIGHRAPTVFLKHSQAISSDLVKEGHG